uniref:G-protein coupled receptors family 1 profile domain-containing protein n=1 Tax=Esox lucius TaxID=8010 RepID=A0A6Q2XTJ4_ESOLU
MTLLWSHTGPSRRTSAFNPLLQMEEHEDDQYCFQDGNSSCRKYTLSTSIYITLYIFFSLISAVTVFLNLLVIISISQIRQVQTPTNLLILSLALSDLLVGLIVIPANTVAIMEPCWVLGKYFCALLMFTSFICTSLSLGNLVLMSIDRYVAVCDPLMYHLKITVTTTMCCLAITWCCSIIYNAALIKMSVNVQVPSGCFEECYFVEGFVWVNIIDLVISNVVPCSAIIPLNLKIFVVARSQARKVFSATVSGDKTVQASRSEKKATKTIGIIVFNYILFWNPFTYIFCMFSNYKFASFISFLPFINSFINPIIYAFFYPWFKETAKRILKLNKPILFLFLGVLSNQIKRVK